MTATNVNRKLYIDALRGLGILLVLIGHNNPPFINLIFGFHMPLFFIISGYLYKDTETERPVVEQMKRIAVKYLIPYCVLSVVNLVLHLIHIWFVDENHIFPPKGEMLRFVIGILKVDPANMPCCGPLWFLVSLAIALFLFYLIRKIPAFTVRGIIFAICVVVSAFLEGVILPFTFHTVCMGLLFLEMGYLFRGYDVTGRITKDTEKFSGNVKLVGLSAALLFVGMIMVFLNNRDLWVDISVARFGIVPLTVVSASMVTYGLLLLLHYLEKVCIAMLKPFVYIGRHTLLILGFDFASNSWGGTWIHKYQLFSNSPTWYQAFGIRIIVLAVFFALWQLLVMIVPGERLKKWLRY